MNRCLIGRSGRISSGGASIRKKKTWEPQQRANHLISVAVVVGAAHVRAGA